MFREMASKTPKQEHSVYIMCEWGGGGGGVLKGRREKGKIELIFDALNFTFFNWLCLLATGERKSEGVCLYCLLACRNKSPIFFYCLFLPSSFGLRIRVTTTNTLFWYKITSFLTFCCVGLSCLTHLVEH